MTPQGNGFQNSPNCTCSSLAQLKIELGLLTEDPLEKLQSRLCLKEEVSQEKPSFHPNHRTLGRQLFPAP